MCGAEMAEKKVQVVQTIRLPTYKISVFTQLGRYANKETMKQHFDEDVVEMSAHALFILSHCLIATQTHISLDVYYMAVSLQFRKHSV